MGESDQSLIYGEPAAEEEWSMSNPDKRPNYGEEEQSKELIEAYRRYQIIRPQCKP